MSVCVLIMMIIPFIIRFERKRITGREIVLLAVLSAVAAVSRIPFAALPSIQPTTFVIIMTGMVFGAESGFVVGAMAALVSNLILGQGPWTPWQMLAWGLIGLAAGGLRNTRLMQTMWGRCVFGLGAGFCFGWLMNVWGLLALNNAISWKSLLAYYSLSFYFDLAHALSNVVFLLLFSRSWMNILSRFKRKYGLFAD
ncbi:ECF transporter S component [Pullulanibacillus camelliae]|nr:ECF transporter S component [Pullulanibacillus camelliae]